MSLAASIYGAVPQYAYLIAMTGSTLLVFMYLWWKGRLDFDEEAAERMLGRDKEEKDDVSR